MGRFSPPATAVRTRPARSSTRGLSKADSFARGTRGPFQIDPNGAPNDALPRYRTEVRDGAVYFEHPAIEVDKHWK